MISNKLNLGMQKGRIWGKYLKAKDLLIIQLR